VNWPVTVAGVIVIVLAVLPGVAAEHLFRAVGGVSWREKDSRQALRLLAFSVLGLVLYVLVAAMFGWSMPDYVIPSTFSSASFSSAQLPALARAYLGHWAGAAIIALLAARATELTARISARSTNRDAWDHFVRCAIPGHWVVVTLQNGESYAGHVDHADVSIEPEYRDVVLAEPYRYDASTDQYAVTYNQYLFLRGSDVVSIAAVYSPEDSRIVSVTATPFEEPHA
jgi:small nuclear ribonucleoprotein (snRNP)-like protein